jgi:protein-L-isoaspartate O-methyltransferase
MKSLEESVVQAMDGSDKELYPFLPYILQDIWEIGADPEVIISLADKLFPGRREMKVLDLGCGKGAVSVKVAKKLGYSCHGIDAVPEFINYAKRKAEDWGVGHLCNFETGDIRMVIDKLPVYDIIILGAIGPVLGDYYSTLMALSHCLGVNGVIIVDDGYIDDSSDYQHSLILKKGEMLQQIQRAGMQWVDEVVIGKEEIEFADNQIHTPLKNRCMELADKYPEKKELFENYIRQQEIEMDVLENKVICATFVLRKANNP